MAPTMSRTTVPICVRADLVDVIAVRGSRRVSSHRLRLPRQTYELNKRQRGGSAVNTSVREWQAKFQELMGEEAGYYDIFNIKYFTGRSIGDALNESLSGELFLFGITCE